MCWKTIKGWFGGGNDGPPPPPEPTSTPEPTPTQPPPLEIPYPEEPLNLDATMENTDIVEALESWMSNRSIPEEHRPFFREHLQLYLDDTFPTAGTWEQPEGFYHLIMHPHYVNDGVIAHEGAHVVRHLLTEEEKQEFLVLYRQLKATDPYIVRLSEIKPDILLEGALPNGMDGITEAHAEVYRYLGEQMPEGLKQYYPKLFVE